MIERIIVPVGMLEQADGFVQQTMDLAKAFAVPVVLLHVMEDAHGGAPDPLSWHMRRQEAEALLQAAAERLERCGVSASVEMVSGDAATEIVKFTRGSADLLLLHEQEREPAQGGGVAWKVLQNAAGAVARAPLGIRPRERQAGTGRILVPLDGSRRAEWVLPYATALATQLKHRLLLAHVASLPETVAWSEEGAQLGEALLKRNQRWMESYLRQLCARLPVPCRWRVSAGAPAAETLLAWGREADLVVLSAHGTQCARGQRYGQIASRFLFEGPPTPLVVLQDVPAELIQPSPAARLFGEAEARAERRTLNRRDGARGRA